MNDFVIENGCQEQVKEAISGVAKGLLAGAGGVAAAGGGYLGFREGGPLRKMMKEDRLRAEYFNDNILPGVVANEEENKFQQWRMLRDQASEAPARNASAMPSPPG